jgi:DNA modification methylase
LMRVVKDDGSIWWNIMDSFNTRTQIRGNAAEALRAMQGKDTKGWNDHECRRYSAGHVFLKDGEQCLIPSRIAERAARLGYYVKSVITWAKTSSLPEPQNSRVSRNLEYILHLSKQRTPKFDKSIYRSIPAQLGGRNNGSETDKLSDVWTLPTSSGRDGHGAQFPLALPGRCIALSTEKGDCVLDPFVGAGNSGVAALCLGRAFVGFDISEDYLETANKRLKNSKLINTSFKAQSTSQPESQENLL